ncbi:type II toxin-antitoxin system PemK/MazF family toxin [Wielerella bovis]|uniref:type II toxin-antitoxin system PemK/MazF family toxin n=1 Tax=Wielerella bovis TaxID=2917790 RepID=UPI002018F62D|nr:type II toxin-antitoxin system PemK/MazF family toxin [Wielerella bovis]ULJ65596.1 type II toxin-antitoxin system PemK/MazF family toxin [Wielerella bovis]ULJ66360.1 type II toxin-antitoxin system PemK/MazF family toxin [Wielerella bovis]
MERGDIFLVNLDPTTGHEQQGTRPVLIISPKAFNALTQVPIVLPITTKSQFARTQGFAVHLDERTKTQGIVRTDQSRALDIQARNGRKLETLPIDLMNEVLAKMATFLS